MRTTASGFLVMMTGLILGGVMFEAYKKLIKKGSSVKYAALILLLTAALGITLGVVCLTKSLTISAIFAIAGTGLPLVAMLVYPYWERSRLIAKHRSSEQHLIKP